MDLMEIVNDICMQFPVPTLLCLYRVYKKKLNKFEIALNVAKRHKV